MISIQAVSKRFGTLQVLSNISLEIESGTTTAIVGPSGTGKSVLIKIIMGLLEPDTGQVRINSTSITQADESTRNQLRKRMGVLFQRAALFDSLTLLENVAFPLQAHQICSEKEAYERAWAKLEDVSLTKHANSLPGEVSIGMRKRAGIARALVTNPELVLFDEPNPGLDPETGQEIYDLIKETSERYHFTGLVISHEIPEVFQVCSRVVVLFGGQIEFDGNIAEFNNSSSAVVRQFAQGLIEGPITI